MGEGGTVLHVGFNKTATTTLQRDFFPALPDCVAIGPLSEGFREFQRLARNLCWATDDEYSAEPMCRFLAEARGSSRRFVVSLEDFSMWNHDGRTAMRLHQVLPDARVLICVRDQRTLLYSKYVGNVKKGGFFSFANHVRELDPDWLHYDRFVASYQERFGRDQVKVLPYELLVEDPSRYLTELRTFVGVESPEAGAEMKLPFLNRGVSRPIRWSLRVSNRLFVPSVNNPRPPLHGVHEGSSMAARLLALDAKLPRKLDRGPGRRDRAVAELLAHGYAESNARLEALTGLRLASYGYRVAERSGTGSAPDRSS